MKKPSRQPSAFASRLEAYDAVQDHCVNIETLAQLLQSCGPGVLDFSTIARAGTLLLHEAEELHEQLQKLAP